MTPESISIYMIEYRHAAFVLFGSSVMQFSLLMCLGIWCGWKPFEPPRPAPPVVFINLSRPASKSTAVKHSALSSNLKAASAKTAQLIDSIDNYIQPILEKSCTVRRTEKPPAPRSVSASPHRKPVPPRPVVRKFIREVSAKPEQKAMALPVPAATSPLDIAPRKQFYRQSISDRLAEIRQQIGGNSARIHPAGNGTGEVSGRNSAEGIDSGARPVSGSEISAYLNLVRRRLEESKIYPASARKRGLSGIAILKFRIDADGYASEPAVEGNVSQELREAALALIRNRRFPAPPKGWHARARIEIPVKYTLKETGFR